MRWSTEHIEITSILGLEFSSGISCSHNVPGCYWILVIYTYPLCQILSTWCWTQALECSFVFLCLIFFSYLDLYFWSLLASYTLFLCTMQINISFVSGTGWVDHNPSILWGLYQLNWPFWAKLQNSLLSIKLIWSPEA